MKLVIAIDPGLSGGIAVMDPDADSPLIYLAPLPLNKLTASKKEIDVCDLKAILVKAMSMSPVIQVYLERQQSMPRDSNQAAFTVGRNYGVLEGVIKSFNLPIEYIPPTTWQNARFKGLPESATTKEKSLLCFKRTFPGVSLKVGPRSSKEHDGMADAANIACYGTMLVKTGQTIVMPYARK